MSCCIRDDYIECTQLSIDYTWLGIDCILLGFAQEVCGLIAGEVEAVIAVSGGNRSCSFGLKWMLIRDADE